MFTKFYNIIALNPSCHRKIHILNLKADVNYLLKKIDKYLENEK